MNQIIPFRFNLLKSAQVAAFFLKRNGGEMSKYITLKMIYLADREGLKRWNVSITGDNPVSMELGPVPSKIYDLTKNEQQNVWNTIIKTKTVKVLELNSDPGTDELSEEEMELLEEIYQKFKGFSFEQMKSYCHDFAEYDKTAGKGFRPIKIEKLLQTIGKSPEEIKRIESAEREMRALENAFRQ